MCSNHTGVALGVVAEWLSRKTRNLVPSGASVRIWPTSSFLLKTGPSQDGHSNFLFVPMVVSFVMIVERRGQFGMLGEQPFSIRLGQGTSKCSLLVSPYHQMMIHIRDQ